MKIQIEIDEETAALVWANRTWEGREKYTMSEIVKDLAEEEAAKYRNTFPKAVERVKRKFSALPSPLENGWFRGEPLENGKYLRAFDEWDEEEDSSTCEYRDGKWYRDGNEWLCHGGVWKPDPSANMQIGESAPDKKS